MFALSLNGTPTQSVVATLGDRVHEVVSVIVLCAALLRFCALEPYVFLYFPRQCGGFFGQEFHSFAYGLCCGADEDIAVSFRGCRNQFVRFHFCPF